MRLEEEHHGGSSGTADRKVKIEAKYLKPLAFLCMDRLITYHHRHVTRSVNAPPSKGPTMAPSANITPTQAVKIGLLCSGTACETTTNEPVKIPALPQPAIALPMMSATELGAIPQMRLPSSNIPSAHRKDHFILKRTNIRP